MPETSTSEQRQRGSSGPPDGRTGPDPGFWSLVREDWETNGRSWSHPAFRALLIYRIGAQRRWTTNPLLRWPLTVVHFVGKRWIRNAYHMTIPYTADIGRRFLMPHAGTIVIHKYAKIGDDCRVLHGATIGALSKVNRDTAPELGDRVSVGTGAVILGHVKIGSDVSIGPNTVVISDVPSHSTVIAGAPRVISAPTSGWSSRERRD